MKPYDAKCGKVQYKPSWEQLQRIARGDNDAGYCLACGAKQHGIEPDTRKAKCDCCGARKVYGAEELVLMRLFYFEEPGHETHRR